MHPSASSSCSKKRSAGEMTAAAAPTQTIGRVHARSGMGMMGACDDSEMHDDDDAATLASASGAPAAAARMPKIRVGNRNLTMHTELIEMRDSTADYQAGRFDVLRSRLDADGFLLVRGVMARSTVQAARTKMLTHLHAKGAIRSGTEWTQGFIEYEHAWNQKNGIGKHKAAGAASAAAGVGSKKMIPGWTVDAESGGLVGSREPDSQVKGWHAIGNSRELTSVYDGRELRSFYQSLFSQDADYRALPETAKARLPAFTTLPSCTWLRAKGPGEVTAEHADYYYFYKNTHIFRDFWREAAPPTPPTADAHAKQLESPRPVSTQSVDERETCQVCRDPRDPDSTLICDLCDHGYHMDCLKPRLTHPPDEEQEWHCYQCQNKSMQYWTCWTPMGDISGHDGRLALVAGSHRLGGYEAPVREDLLPKEYTKAFESASVWQTPTAIGMGDLILFNVKLIHAATKNAGEKFRLSLDTRVTTCKGKAYCEKHHIDSWEQAVQAMDTKEAAATIVEAASMPDIVDAVAAKVKAGGATKSARSGKITFAAKKQRVAV